ncbi:MAG: TonB-dependent receptor plug domain-containing protein, partial [Kiritimatiellae bacterium]|nr:TonB-dependent receptor plug domain-containing protein [Kiritimatiellia bacterium]
MKKLSFLRLSLTSLLLGTGAGFSFAQTEEPAQTNAVIVITAAPLPKYRVSTNDAGTLVDLPPEKSPFTVDTLTEDFIRERNVTDLDQLLALQPGIYQGGKTMMTRNAGTYTIRGFGRNEVLMGGVPLAGGAAIFMDPALLERVDIVKGPVGGAYGAQTTNSSMTDMGGSGGTILLTPKQASFEEDFTDLMTRASYSRSAGSRLKFTADLNRVDETERAAVRLPFAYEWREPGWAPSGARHGTMFSAAPSLSWKTAAHLTTGLDLFYQYNDQPAYQGIRTAYGKPLFTGWDDTYTEAGDRMKFTTFGGTLRLDGELTDWVKTRTRASYFQTHTDYRYRGPFSNMGFPKRGLYEWAAGDRIARNLYLGQDFIFEFETGDVEHTFLTGVNLFNKRNNGKGAFSSAGPVDLDTLEATDESQLKLGLQAQDVMKWKGLALLTGIRADWHDSVNHAHAWTYSPRFGISYDI